MKIFILPVSGGGFATQLGILYYLLEAKRIIPDIVLGSSGGNVAAYISMLSNWYHKTILKNCHLINSSLFVDSWTPSFIPTWLLFPLTKSVFRQGNGISDLFNEIFTERSIKKVEIWTGTYNETSQRAQFWCNLNKEESNIQPLENSGYIYDMEDLSYSNGDINLISKYTYGSAAIPYLTPGIEINGQKYIDGGAAYSSPLIPLSGSIKNAIITKNSKLQIHYFSSYDMDQRFSDSMYSSSVGLLIHSILLKDRAFALSFLHNFGKGNQIPIIYKEVNKNIMEKILKDVENKHYLMIFSPTYSPTISITNFTGNDLSKLITKVKFSIHLWVLD